MKIHDVTLTIRPGMVVWPGDPQVELHRIQKIENGANANVSLIHMGVHTGTHVDAPYHFLLEGKAVDTLRLEVLIGPARVVELPDDVAQIDEKVVERFVDDKSADRVLFKTRNSRYWAEGQQEFQPGFVGITEDGAQALVAKGTKLVGIDYLSIAPYKKSRPTHEVLLKSSMVVIEGLDLSAVQDGLYTLYCLPLKFKDTDGAPARVILLEE